MVSAVIFYKKSVVIGYTDLFKYLTISHPYFFLMDSFHPFTYKVAYSVFHFFLLQCILYVLNSFENFIYANVTFYILNVSLDILLVHIFIKIFSVAHIPTLRASQHDHHKEITRLKKQR